MVDGSSVGHALSFDVRNGGSILTTGHILGTKAACTLTMTGNGVLELGNGAGWSGDNTWSGDTTLQSGWITVRRPGALSSLSDSVHIAADAGVDYDLNATTPHAVSAATWTGSGNLRALYASDLQLTADSSAFTGTLDGMFGGQIGVLGKAGGNAWTHNDGGVLRARHARQPQHGLAGHAESGRRRLQGRDAQRGGRRGARLGHVHRRRQGRDRRRGRRLRHVQRRRLTAST